MIIRIRQEVQSMIKMMKAILLGFHLTRKYLLLRRKKKKGKWMKEKRIKL